MYAGVVLVVQNEVYSSAPLQSDCESDVQLVYSQRARVHSAVLEKNWR